MFRFHEKHGQNITFSEDMMVASRTQSFANALVFSHRPMEENEVFLVEISGHEKGWAGHLRCGITLHNPGEIVIPQYLLPDLYQLGKSCVFSIKPSKKDPFNDLETNEKRDGNRSHCKYFNSIKKCDTTHNVNPELACQNLDVYPCELGSRIGFFISQQREMFMIINGEQYGPCAGKIPSTSDVYAALDLYGMTSQIRIISCSVPRLATICKSALRSHYDYETIFQENMPKILKNKLLRLYGKNNELDSIDEKGCSSKKARFDADSVFLEHDDFDKIAA